jgi:cis-3-alkyl-4-acyloxetan-2-one decarboxylase
MLATNLPAPELLAIDEVPVRIEGNPNGQVVLMVPGWPDTLELWDSAVVALQEQYRCVRFTLPGFAPQLPPRAMSLARLVTFYARVVQTVSPNRPVILLMHDWGAIFGYEFLAQHPSLVERVISVDIGDHNRGAYVRSLNVKQKAMALGYQLWLACAWKVGETLSTALGTRMTRWMAQAIGYRGNVGNISWQMCYPYAMKWFGTKGGFKGMAPVRVTRPTLYLYGERKPFMFHSSAFLMELSQTPGCAAQGFPCGHWVMGKCASEMEAAILQWLAPA